jgi:hypothetical protein
MNATQSAMACCNNKGTRMLQTCNGATEQQKMVGGSETKGLSTVFNTNKVLNLNIYVRLNITLDTVSCL